MIGTIKSAIKQHITPVLVFDGPPETLKRAPNPQLIQQARDTYQIFMETQNPNNPELAELLFDSPAIRSYFAAYHLKDLCHALGVPVITAPSEAEMTTAALCRDGLVGTVVSNDADALLFGSLHVTKGLRFMKKEIDCITLEELLNGLNLQLGQLRDLAILCGCDFHKKGLKGIGPRKGSVLLKRHGNLEGVLKAKGIPSSERESFLLSREVFDEADLIDTKLFNLTLHAPIASKLIRMLTLTQGRDWAERTAIEFVKLRKNFGLLQATLEAWC
jgi:5'-3' exonuclease